MKPDEQALAALRRRRNLLAVVGVLALVFLSVATFKSYRDLQVGRGRERELRREILASEERVEALEQRVTRLEEDPATIEQLAREELMMARPGEVVIVLPAAWESEPAASAAPGEGISKATGEGRAEG